ncbi:hypothetical protein FNW52_11775 [Flavobacterium sp. ZT3R18]|uniref:hypothetical protein n=1 Tax=Flavobacterium sp. ZT3R18 TaxID=2594429 RepID=UPI00117ADBF9|nr:hypothetical protein [Flavobacterium sp. ZT3R18]TRX35105.1 hypothetical protein FNW52_11775 [Flavobacterium sp. ZT3R18]
MNEKIKITFNKKKMLDSIEINEQANIIILLLILKHSIIGNTKSVSLSKLAFIYDAINKTKTIKKNNVLLSSPWHISKNLRKLIVIANEQKLIKINVISSSVKFCLNEKGETILTTIETQDLFVDLVNQINDITTQVKESDLDNQQLIW